MDAPSGLSVLMMAIIGVILTVIASSFLAASTRKQWEKLKPELFPDISSSAQSGDETVGFRPWPRLLPNILGSSLDNALNTLKNEAGITPRGTLKASPEWTVRGPEVTNDALDAGDIRSILWEKEGRYVYIVAVPNRHEHPSLLQKYSCFAAGWPAHFERLRDSLAAQSEFSFLAGFLICLDPDGKDGVQFCSVADRDMVAVPVALVPQTDRRAANSDATFLVLSASDTAARTASSQSVAPPPPIISNESEPRVAVGSSL